MIISNPKLTFGDVLIEHYKTNTDWTESFIETDKRWTSKHTVKYGYISEMIKLHRDFYGSIITY